MKRVFRYIALLLGSSIMIALAACAPQTTNTTSAQEQPLSFYRTVPLTHSPTGMVDLSWNAASQVLTVHVTATGLAPKSTHPEHIHVGTCTRTPMGAIIYTLTPLKANARGVGTSETTITGVTSGIPASGWSVNIHNGPTLNTELEARPIACGTIYNKSVSLASNQQAHLILLDTKAPDENVHGMAQIVLEKNTLTVTLRLSGLAPHTTHMVHIHAGSCASQGPVVYALQPVVADLQGDATTTTTISNITHFPVSQVYINVHEAGTMATMSTQQGFNPLACGMIA